MKANALPKSIGVVGTVAEWSEDGHDSTQFNDKLNSNGKLNSNVKHNYVKPNYNSASITSPLLQYWKSKRHYIIYIIYIICIASMLFSIRSQMSTTKSTIFSIGLKLCRAFNEKNWSLSSRETLYRFYSYRQSLYTYNRYIHTIAVYIQSLYICINICFNICINIPHKSIALIECKH